MFERAFNWSMRHGAHVLFVAAILTLLGGIFALAWELRGSATLTHLSLSMLVSMFLSQLIPAAFLFLGAVLADRLRRD